MEEVNNILLGSSLGPSTKKKNSTQINFDYIGPISSQGSDDKNFDSPSKNEVI